VLMFHDPLPDETLWAFSSKAILEELKPYVTSNGSAPAPSRSEILKHAFSTRDRIEFGDRIKVSATGAFTAADAPAGMRPRSASSIQTGVDFTRLLMLQAGYREYSLHNLDALGGQVVLAFVISPTGIVQDARVVSTTFRDRGFVEYILNVIRQTNFGPGDFGDTRVNEFPISFFPKGSAGL